MKHILRLITDTSVYREITHWSSLKLYSTFFFLSLLAATASTAVYFTTSKPRFEASALETWNNLVQNWDKNLVITYKNGTLSATPSAIIRVHYPENTPETQGLPSELALLDTTTSEHPTSPNSLVVITQKEIGTLESAGSYHWTSLSEVLTSDVTFDQAFLEEQTPAAHAFIAVALTILGVFVFIGNALFLPVLRLALALLFTFLTPSIFAMFGNTKHWKTVWKIGVILLPLAELAQIAITALTQPTPLHIFWIIWLAMIVIVNLCNPRKIL